jgi:hypothetical protein
MGFNGLTWHLFYPVRTVLIVNQGSVVVKIMITLHYSPEQLCASSRGNTEGASVIYDD